MNVIYCGKQNSEKYYIKEADLSISSIQELAFFIYNYAMLISNSFISKSLIIHIDKHFGQSRLASDINEMFNKKTNLAIILTHILANSNFYNDEEIGKFRARLIKLLSLPENEYIEKAGDKLFHLKKYEKAISQYSKIININDNGIKKLGLCYAKLQFYDNAAEYLGRHYKKTFEIDSLKQAYFCLKLSGRANQIYEYEKDINEELLADWEYEIVSDIIKVRRSDEIKNIDDIFLMGQSHIKESISNLIKIWKEKYRYIG